MTDFGWCCDEVLRLVKASEADDVGWEDFIIRHMVEKKFHTTWNDRTTWVERSPRNRITILYQAIDRLIQMKRIYAAPEKEQATGRRLFRPTNVLDSIAQSL